MKKNFTLLLILGALAVYSYQFIYKKAVRKSDAEALDMLVETQRVKKISITSDFGEMTLEKREGFWWVTDPNLYPAHPEMIEKALSSMEQAPSQKKFELIEDRFGLSPGRAFFELTYNNEERVRLVVGAIEGPRNTLYVLNKDTNQVSVVHNVWGQLLYYPQEEYYHPSLPVVGKQVKGVERMSGNKILWSVSSKQKKMARLEYSEKEHNIEKSDLLWFFHRLREFSIKNLDFSGKSHFPDKEKLVIKTEKGNIIFLFDEKNKKIFIPSLNVFADYDSFSLESLDVELEKVIKSDKK